MTDIERIESKLTALGYRLAALEASPHVPCLVAQAVAVELGLPPDSVCNRGASVAKERAQVALELKRRGWSQSAIARALHCPETSVRRYLTKTKNPAEAGC